MEGPICQRRYHNRGVRLARRDPDEFGTHSARRAKRRLKIAAYDFGMKWNIMRRLSAQGSTPGLPG
jgi:carbamoylphosphate synthase small subunit